MKKLLFIPLAALMAFSLAAVTKLPDNPNNKHNNKLRMAEMAITRFYVDSVDEERLVEDAIRNMLMTLDPHSAYSTAEETRQLNEPLEGNFSGIGISFNMLNDTVRVISTVAGGPSERIGLLPGDRIVRVNDTLIAGVKMLNTDIMKRLRGPKGSEVNITVLRFTGGKADTIPFRIKRDDIPIYSVDAAYMVDPHTGYIRINKFGAETAKEVNSALVNLQKKGMTQLILDLTDNGGGYLQAAPDILGEMLEPGSLAVYMAGRNVPRRDFTVAPAGNKPLFPDGRLVVMTNQYTASAAEIAAGALQDWDRGLIVGRRTFGKGLVQRPVPFPDGSMMRLTVAHYYTPTGRDIQKPYKKGDQRAYALDILDRFNHGELMHADSVKHVDSLRVATKLLNRPVYGGGGIYPDKFVGLDTTENTRYYRNIMAKGILLRYAAEYADAHRKELRAKYKTDDDFVARFEVSQAMLDDIRRLAEADKVEYNAEEAATSAPLLKMIIKALIGRDAYDTPTYFKVYNEHDPIFREARRLINSPDYDRLLSTSAN